MQSELISVTYIPTSSSPPPPPPNVTMSPFWRTHVSFLTPFTKNPFVEPWSIRVTCEQKCLILLFYYFTKDSLPPGLTFWTVQNHIGTGVVLLRKIKMTTLFHHLKKRLGKRHLLKTDAFKLPHQKKKHTSYPVASVFIARSKIACLREMLFTISSESS